MKFSDLGLAQFRQFTASMTILAMAILLGCSSNQSTAQNNLRSAKRSIRIGNPPRDWTVDQLCQYFSEPRHGIWILNDDKTAALGKSFVNSEKYPALIEMLKDAKSDTHSSIKRIREVDNVISVLQRARFSFFRENGRKSNESDFFKDGKPYLEHTLDYLNLQIERVNRKDPFAIIDVGVEGITEGIFSVPQQLAASMGDLSKMDYVFKTKIDELRQKDPDKAKAKLECGKLFMSIVRLDTKSTIRKARDQIEKMYESGYWPAVELEMRVQKHIRFLEPHILKSLDVAKNADAVFKSWAAYNAVRYYDNLDKQIPQVCEQLLKEAVSEDIDSAYCTLATYYKLVGRNKDAVSIFTKGANKNVAACQAWLGRSYVTGDIVQKDFDKGFRLIEAAHKQGHIDGTYFLALCYFQGPREMRDYKKGHQLMLNAANRKHIRANYRVGFHFWNGINDTFGQVIVKRDQLQAANAYFQVAKDLAWEHGDSRIRTYATQALGHLDDYVKGIRKAKEIASKEWEEQQLRDRLRGPIVNRPKY